MQIYCNIQDSLEKWFYYKDNSYGKIIVLFQWNISLLATNFQVTVTNGNYGLLKKKLHTVMIIHNTEDNVSAQHSWKHGSDIIFFIYIHICIHKKIKMFKWYWNTVFKPCPRLAARPSRCCCPYSHVLIFIHFLFVRTSGGVPSASINIVEKVVMFRFIKVKVEK